MIKVSAEGTLPLLPKSETILSKLAEMLGKDIIADARAGGNPAWKPTIFGRKANLHYIAETMKTTAGENFAQAEFGAGDSLKYAKVHERGMNIPKSRAMQRAIWAKMRGRITWVKGSAVQNRLIIPKRSALTGISARSEKYAKFLGEQFTTTESIPLFKGATS